MKNLIIIIFSFLICVNTYAQKKPKIKGDKNVTKTNYKIPSGFNAIEIDDALELKINHSNENSYTLNADLNLHSTIQFAVHDSVLKIYCSHNIVKFKKSEIWLNYETIEKITLQNDAKIISENIIECSNMQFSAYQDSEFNVDIKAKELRVNLYNNTKGKISSSSDTTIITAKDKSSLETRISTNETTVYLTESAEIKISGDTETARYNLKDNSKLDASKIKCESVKLIISDSTRAEIFANKDLDLTARGSSAIYLYGEPEIKINAFKDKVQLIKK